MTSKRFGERSMGTKLNGTRDYTGAMIDKAGGAKLVSDTKRRADADERVVELLRWSDGDTRNVRLQVSAHGDRGVNTAIFLSRMKWQQFWIVNVDNRDYVGLGHVDLELQDYAA